MELNYGIRNHFLPVVSKEINLDIVPDAGIRFPTLHPCELFATKINALIERRAVRDLFDVYSLSQSNMLSTLREREMLKKGIVFYQTIGVEGTARKEIDLSGIMGGYGASSSTISIIPPWLMLGALVFATLIGLVSGILPANKAVKISALEAIRHD